MNVLDEVLEAAAADIWRATEELPIRRRQFPRARQPRMALTLLAAASILATAVGVALVVRSNESASVGGPPMIDVHHSRIEVTLAAQLECETQIDTTDTFATMVIDSYSDRGGRQWRTQVTYPDGSTVDFIARGSAVYPTGAFQRGDYRGSDLGCISSEGERLTLVSEPYRGGSFFALDLLGELSPDEIPYVRPLREMSSRVDGDRVDSRGRPSQLWEYRNEGGTMSFGSVQDVDVTQISTWWVDPSDSETVTEQRYSTTVETLGSATQTLTLVFNESIDVPVDFFDTTGYEVLETSPRPDLHGSPTDDTIATTSTIAAVVDGEAQLPQYLGRLAAFSESEGAVITEVLNRSVQDCMVEQGFEYEPVVVEPSDATVEDVLYPTPEELAAYGYGWRSHGFALVDISTIVPNSESAPGLAACGASAGAAFDFSAYDEASQVLTDADSRVISASVKNDERTLAANAEWKSCMSDAGYTFDTWGDAERSTYADGMETLPALALAKVDYGCRNNYHLAEIERELRREYVAAWVESHPDEMEALASAKTALLLRAQAILGSLGTP